MRLKLVIKFFLTTFKKHCSNTRDCVKMMKIKKTFEGS